jgi:hypothetical protein
MPVITRRQSRGHHHPDAINESERVRPEDGLSSVHGDEERESVWDESGSGVSGEESDYEESDNADLDDDLEGTFDTIKRRASFLNCVHSNPSHGKTPEGGEGCAPGESFVIKISRKV